MSARTIPTSSAVILVLAVAIVAVRAAPASATFPGEDGRIAFDTFGRSDEIFTANPDGSDVRRLTSSPGHSYSAFPDWSPDGERIAFESNRVDVDGRKDVEQTHVINADGSGETQLTRGGRYQVYPAWSPDGDSLAIAAEWGGGDALGGIWIIPASDPDGVTRQEAQRVTSWPTRFSVDVEPQFSPDGSSIVFTRHERHGVSAIQRVGIDGRGRERLTPWRLSASDPDWSPDGQRIAFDSRDSDSRRSGLPGTKQNIYVMRADGSGRTRLTDRPPVRKGKGIKGANNPVWSPSGTQIMYTRFFPKRTELGAMNPDGSGKHVVIGGRFGKRRLPDRVDWGTHP